MRIYLFTVAEASASRVRDFDAVMASGIGLE